MAYRCEVCGYVHQGSAPPDECPVCGAGRDLFAPLVQAAPASPPRQWRCTVCGYIHEGDEPPDECPVCGAGREDFEEITDEAAGDAGPPRRIVIVGAGIAGLTAAEAARRQAPGAAITLLTAEPGLPYYRLTLTRYLAQEIDAAALEIHPAAWYAERRVTVRPGTVAAIARERHEVGLEDGTVVPYDALVVATGATPFVPPIPGAALEGVLTLRSRADAERILARVTPAVPVVCLGGGLLGLETAGALSRRGARVVVLETAPSLLPRQLARPAGELLAEHLAARGIETRRGVQVTAIVATPDGLAVTLADGARLAARFVVIAAGVRPDLRLARAAGLTVKAGLVVDGRMATSDPAVFAAGDVAEHGGIVPGIWPVAYAQGLVAGANAAGGQSEFAAIPLSNRLKVVDVDVFSVGEVEPREPGGEITEHRAGGAYYRLVSRAGILTGANLFGDARLARPIERAVTERRQLGDVAAVMAGLPSGRFP
jgi:nitrite reductase (NADH) large subunit